MKHFPSVSCSSDAKPSLVPQSLAEAFGGLLLASAAGAKRQLTRPPWRHMSKLVSALFLTPAILVFLCVTFQLYFLN